MDFKDWHSKNPWVVTQVAGKTGVGVGDIVSFGQEVSGKVEITVVTFTTRTFWANVMCNEIANDRNKVKGAAKDTSKTTFEIISSKPSTQEQVVCALVGDVSGLFSGASWTAVEGGGGAGGGIIGPPKRPKRPRKSKAL